MAEKVALINMKGGVGKSTLAANLAWAMATWDKRVLVVDLDPQFNCSQYLLGVAQIETILSGSQPTVRDILERPRAINPTDAIFSVYRSRSGGSIGLIPSRLELSQALRNPAGKEHLFKRAIDELEKTYDLVIVDCAPTESMLTMAAYLAADYLLVPVRPEYLSTIGLPLLEQSLEYFATLYPGNSSPEVLGLVFNGVSDYSPEEVTSKSEVRRVAGIRGWPVFDAEVRYSKSYPKGAREGSPVSRTTYAHWYVKDNFALFAHEFAQQVGM